MESKEIGFSELLQAVQEGLKHCSVQELKEGIFQSIRMSGELKPDIAFIIDIVCSEYDVSKGALIGRSRRGSTQIAREMAYCLLHTELSLSTRTISKSIFFRNMNCIALPIRRFKKMDTRIKTDREFLETYEKLRKKIEVEININRKRK